MKIIKICTTCQKEFLYRNCPSDRKAGNGKYCSKKCCDKNMSKILKERGIRPVVRFIGIDENHPGWKGQDASYSAFHYWVSRKLGKPRACTHCGVTTAKKYEWANKSGLYLRDLTDWIRLCVSCHRKYDGHAQKAWETRRRLYA